MNNYIKKKCVNGVTISCNTEDNLKLYCCEIPGHEIQKTRHYTNMNRNYYTRLEDRIKAKLKSKKCNDRTKVTKNYTFNNNDELKYAINLWINSNNVAFCEYGHIGNWNTSEINDMSGLFRNNIDFNEDISRWDVGKVINFRNMFENASSFNQNISIWNVGENINNDTNSIIYLGNMFYGATQMINNQGADSSPSLNYFNQ